MSPEFIHGRDSCCWRRGSHQEFLRYNAHEAWSRASQAAILLRCTSVGKAWPGFDLSLIIVSKHWPWLVWPGATIPASLFGNLWQGLTFSFSNIVSHPPVSKFNRHNPPFSFSPTSNCKLSSCLHCNQNVVVVAMLASPTGKPAACTPSWDKFVVLGYLGIVLQRSAYIYTDKGGVPRTLELNGFIESIGTYTSASRTLP